MSEEIRRAIAAGNQKFMDAISQGDAPAVAALYTATARAPAGRTRSRRPRGDSSLLAGRD
jgi:hypothetical protein